MKNNQEYVYLTAKGIITVALDDWKNLSNEQRDILEYLNSVGAVNPQEAEHVENVGFGLKNPDLRTSLTGLWWKSYVRFQGEE